MKRLFEASVSNRLTTIIEKIPNDLENSLDRNGCGLVSLFLSVVALRHDGRQNALNGETTMWNLNVTIYDIDGNKSTHNVQFISGYWTTGREHTPIEGWNLGNVCGALHRTFDVSNIEVFPHRVEAFAE